jgi:hypothetical protein
MKIFFNGWFSGFLDKTNPGVTVDFFLELFKNVYNETCEIGNENDSDILCEFDMLIDCVGTLVNYTPLKISNRTAVSESVSTKLPVTDLKQAHLRCADSNLHRYKQWKHTYLFNGESTMRCDTNNYDIVLSCERNCKNNVNVPLFIPYVYTNNFIHKLIEPKNITNVPKKEVCVIISNPGGEVRNNFLNNLDKYFKVTYAGSYKNNIGEKMNYHYNTSEFIEFVSQFKFIISMENSRCDTYITEKIIHGLLANTVPVYWGSTRVSDYFNMNRLLNLDDENSISSVIQKMVELNNNNQKWLEMVNQTNFIDNKLERNIEAISNDIRCIFNKSCWNHITSIYCINNPEFEPDRHIMLKNMFHGLNIKNDYVKYISPTYGKTITSDTYNKYTSNQFVRHLRKNNLSPNELSLFLNYRAVLENIEKNHKDGLFLIFESDVMISKDIDEFNNFLNVIHEKDFDLIHLGLFDNGIFSKSIADFRTGYRLESGKISNEVLEYHKKYTIDTPYIEDVTTNEDRFRIIRKFNTRCTDSFLWKYSGIIKFLDFMRKFEDYSCPFDYYMCNFFENNLDFKHYWSLDEFFKQGSNSGLVKSTLR